MATEKVIYDADVGKMATAIERIINKEVKLRRGIKQTKGETKKAGGAFSQLGKNAGAQLLTMGAGVVSVTALVAGLKTGWSMVQAEMQKVVNVQKQMAAANRPTLDLLKDVANQLNITLDAKGLVITQGRVERLMRGAGISDTKKAANIDIAGNVAWEQRLGAEKEAAMSLEAAKFAKMKNLGTEQVSGFVEILGGTDAEDKKDLKLKMEQLYIAQRKSKTKKFELFMEGSLRSMPIYRAAGGSYVSGLAAQTIARNVKPTDELAAQLVKQTGELLYKDKVKKALTSYHGISEDQLAKTGYDEQRNLLGQWVSESVKTPEGRMKLQKTLEGRQYSQATAMYGEGNFAKKAAVIKEIESANLADYDQAMNKYQKSVVGLIERAEAVTAANKKFNSIIITLGDTKKEEYKTVWDKHIAGEKKLDYFDSSYYLRDDKGEQDWVAWHEMQGRLGRAGKSEWRTFHADPFAGGDYVYDTSTEASRAYKKAHQHLERIEPHVGDPLTPKEVGTMEMLLKELENLTTELKKNTEATHQSKKNAPAPAVPGSPFN